MWEKLRIYLPVRIEFLQFVNVSLDHIPVIFGIDDKFIYNALYGRCVRDQVPEKISVEHIIFIFYAYS